MSNYKNINVELDEEDEEPLDMELDEESENSDEEPVTDNPKDEPSKDGVKSEESQLAGMIIVVWILAIIGLTITVASTFIKHRQQSEVKTEYVNVVSGMYSMTDLTTEDQVWTDSLVVEKKIQSNGNTIAFYLTGKATSYGKIIYIPVTRNDFNAIENGSSVSFTYSRLNIDGKENIIVHQWSKS